MAAPVLKVGPRRLGTELWGTDRTICQLRPLRGAWFAAAPDVQFEKFVTRYRGRYGKTPYRLASLGYDSVLLAVRSRTPIGRSAGPFPLAALIDSEGFAGVDGSFRFGPDGIAERLLEVREVGQAGATSVSPARTVVLSGDFGKYRVEQQPACRSRPHSRAVAFQQAVTDQPIDGRHHRRSARHRAALPVRPDRCLRPAADPSPTLRGRLFARSAISSSAMPWPLRVTAERKFSGFLWRTVRMPSRRPWAPGPTPA